MSYEANIERLNGILEKIESPETEIAESLRLYEEGVAIASECLQELKDAKGKVSVLQRELDAMIETDFEAIKDAGRDDL